MDRRVTSPTRGPPPPCKQALNYFKLLVQFRKTQDSFRNLSTEENIGQQTKTWDTTVTNTSVILQCIYKYCHIFLDIKTQQANQVYSLTCNQALKTILHLEQDKLDGAQNPLSKVLKGLVSNLFMNLSTQEFRHHVFPKNFDNLIICQILQVLLISLKSVDNM